MATQTPETTLADRTDDQSRIVQVNARVPDALHRQFKSAASLKGLTVNDALVDAIQSYIGQQKEGSHA